MPNKKPYNNGQWTEARFHSFIKGGLRSMTRRWGPIHSTLKKARTERGRYRCVGFNRNSHVVPVSAIHGNKRQRNVFVDHVQSIIPITGFTTWDDVIKRMFVEEEGLQVLCKECHDNKTQEERTLKNGAKTKSN